MARSVVKWFWIDGKIGHWLAFWLVILLLTLLPFLRQSKMITTSSPSVEVWTSDVATDTNSITEQNLYSQK